MVAQFGDKTYLATVTVQTTAADNPTYVRDCHDNPQRDPGAAARRGQPLLSRRMPARWRRAAVGDVLTAQLGFDEFLGERVLVTVDLNTAAATRPGRAAHAMPRCSARRSITHCTCLEGPAVVRISNATYIPMVAGRVRARQCLTLTRLYPSLRLTIGKPIVVATTRVFSVIGRR